MAHDAGVLIDDFTSILIYNIIEWSARYTALLILV